jgi:3-oxoacyl-[acyl-carrier protein] reductase
MDLELRGKVAIVGGASMGIGYGIARELAAEGARVAITARRDPGLSEAAAKIRAETSAEVLPILADCRRAEDCARVVETTVVRLGGIDSLVNNDGAPPLGELASFDDTAWAKAVEQNLMYVVRMTRAVAPHMKARGGGGILNITAISAIQPIPGFGLSVATWGGVIGFAKTLSLEVARDNINVNTICPGYIETQRLEKVFASGGQDPQVMRA